MTLKLHRLDTETINDIIEAQLATWEMAKKNFDALSGCRRKLIQVGDMGVAVQCNPARIRSTGADISKEAIATRKCFLCRDNRPTIQHTIPLDGNLELLVNPFPIFPVHFTIAARDHRPQTAPPLAMAPLAAMAPDLCIFFNGAKAGASAPDHLHLQGILSSELPLLKITERIHPVGGKTMMWSDESGVDLPFRYLSVILPPDETDMKTLLTLLTTFGKDNDGEIDPGLVNTYIWTDKATGILRGIAIPRKAHRPSCYHAEGDGQLLVSPGAIDMAGVIITPRNEDFDKITGEDIRKIYSETAFL